MVNEKMGFWCGLGARRCDSCKSAPSVLFCRADAAYLCGACDPRAHGDVAARHEREWLCEVCEQAPATITCKADAAVLCAACDADIHSANPLARRHERAPLVPFVDPLVSGAAIRPAAAGLPHEAAATVEEDDAAMEVASAAASWTLSNPCVKVLMETPEGKSAQEFLFEMDPYLDLEYANTRDARFQQADRVVPLQEKPTAGEGGAATPEPFPPTDCAFELDFVASKPSQSTYTAESLIHNVSSLEFGVVPDGSRAKGQATDVTDPHASGGVGRAADRKARVMRYREKRKTRRFEKTIRYATRKAYAETRPRIKGRFVKRTEIEAEKVGRMYSRSALIVNAGYGVVPPF